MSLFIEENCFNFLGNRYERTFQHTCLETGIKLKYRIIIGEDDYDYIEDQEEIQLLDVVFNLEFLQSDLVKDVYVDTGYMVITHHFDLFNNEEFSEFLNGFESDEMCIDREEMIYETQIALD